MARVNYSMGVSLDGYIKDADDNFAWGAPDDELHRHYNQQARETQAFLFGRRLYEAMEPYWPDAAQDPTLDDTEAEFARIYVDTPRFVFSDTLKEVSEGARLVRRAEAGAEVTRLKEADGGPLGIGGAGLAASLFDLIDEFELRVYPVLLGGGTPYFPPLRDRADLRFVGSRTLSSVVLLRYERTGVGA